MTFRSSSGTAPCQLLLSERKLGQGTCSTCIQVREQLTERHFAVKVAAAGKSADVLEELGKIKHLSHPNIMRYFAAVTDNSHQFVGLIMPKADCDLLMYLEEVTLWDGGNKVLPSGIVSVCFSLLSFTTYTQRS